MYRRYGNTLINLRHVQAIRMEKSYYGKTGDLLFYVGIVKADVYGFAAASKSEPVAITFESEEEAKKELDGISQDFTAVKMR